MVQHANQRRGFTPTSLMMRTVSICTMIWAAGCHSGEPSVSEMKHNVGEPVRSPRASQYAQMDADQYEEIMAPLVGVNPRDILPASNPLAKRLQYWVDAVDRQMRESHPEELALVPTPLIRVVKDSTANAFVAPAPVCYQVSVTLPGVTGRSGKSVDRVYLELADGLLSDFPEEFKCLEPEGGVAELKEILADANGKMGDCRYDVSSAGELSLSKGCKVDDTLKGVSKARQVIVMKTASYVTVFTGIVPLMSEEAIVAAVTHELGHYYRAHPTVQDSDFGYFYKLEAKQAAKRPEPDLSLKEVGQAAVESATALSSSDVMGRLEKQELRSELFFAAGSVVKSLCRSGKRCPATCKETYALMGSSEFEEGMGFFPFSDVEKVELAVYKKFEEGALACFEEVKFAANPKELEAASIGWDVVSDLVKTPTWPTWLDSLPGTVQRAVTKLNSANSERLAKNPPRATTLAEAFLAASTALADQDQAHMDVLLKAQRDGLGQYTIEQEADEFSAEWVAKTGVNPSSAVEAMRSLGKGSDTSLRGFILGEDDCEKLWKNGWSKETSDYYFVPVGDYSEIHHSTCYRMFNLEREIQAHDYTVAQTDAQTLSAAEWAKLKRMAASLSPSEELLRLVADVPFLTKFRNSYLKGCSYSPRFH